MGGYRKILSTRKDVIGWKGEMEGRLAEMKAGREGGRGDMREGRMEIKRMKGVRNKVDKGRQEGRDLGAGGKKDWGKNN